MSFDPSQSQLAHSQMYAPHYADEDGDDDGADDGGNDALSPEDALVARGPPTLEEALCLNALASTLDPLPQPYRLIASLVSDIVSSAWDRAQDRAREGQGDEAAERERRRRRRGIVVETDDGQEAEDEEPAAARVQVAEQQHITRMTDMQAAVPSRTVAPLYPPPGQALASSGAPLAPSLPSSCASVSQDGRLAVLGSRMGAVYVADLNRAFSFVFALQGTAVVTGNPPPAAADAVASGPASPRGTDASSIAASLRVACGPISAVAISPLAISRGDEDPLGDELETHANYLLAWSSTPLTLGAQQTVRVATLNAHSWQLFEGCTITLPAVFPVPASAAGKATVAATAALLNGTPGTLVTGLQFARDGSHLSVAMADGSHSIFQLRAHRYDSLLEPPRVSQKEQLLKGLPPAPGRNTLGVPGANSIQQNSLIELQSILSDSALEVNAQGLSYVENRHALSVVQQKLYTATMVMHAKPSRALIDTLRAAQMRKEASAPRPATGGAATAVVLPVALPPLNVSPSPLKSPAGSPSKSAASNRRASMKMTDSAAAVAAGVGAASPAAMSAAAAASNAAAAAAYASSVASPTSPPVRCIAPATVHFLQSMQVRHAGQFAPPSYVTSGVAILWQADTAWARWELAVPKPVLPGESPAALAKLAQQRAMQVMSPPGSPNLMAKSQAAAASTGSKSGKADKAIPDPIALAAAAAAQSEAELYARPAPATLSITTGCRMSASALESSSSFLAVGLHSGTVVLYDLRMGAAVRLVLHGTPSLSHAGAKEEPFDPDAAPQPAQVMALAFLNASHIVAGLADATVRTFTLPARLARDPPARVTTDAALPVRISTKLPGVVQSIRIGSKLPVAIVGVSSDGARSRVTAGKFAPIPSAPQELFVYDILSNHVIGKLLPPAAPASAPSGSTDLYNFSPSLLVAGDAFDDQFEESKEQYHPAAAAAARDAVGGDSLSNTGAFTVYSPMEDGVQRLGEFGNSTFGRSLPQLRPSQIQNQGGDSFRAMDSPRHGASAAAAVLEQPMRFHALVSSMGPFPTENADHIVLLASTSSGDGSTASTSSVLVYSLADLVCALYPSIGASCSNAFLRQQHAVGLFLAHSSHAARRAPGAFAAYLAAQDRVVARSSQAALSAAFASGAGRSSAFGSKFGSTRASPRSMAHSRMGSAGGGGGHSRMGSAGAGGHGRTGSYQPALSSIYGGSSVGGGGGSVASSMGRSRDTYHGRQGSASSMASHKRTGSSRSRERAVSAAHSVALAAATRAVNSLPADLPRDAAFLVSSALNDTLSSAGQRSAAALKQRRSEMHRQLQVQQKMMQQQTARAGGTTFPRIVQASR